MRRFKRAQIEQIRQLALDLAHRGAEPSMLMVCSPISEPGALPA